MRSGIALVVVLAAAQSAAGQNIYQRATAVKALIGGAARDRAGEYNASGTSSLCGEVAKEASLTGEGGFIVEFPGADKITSIAFGSNQLVGTVTTANRFRLSVGVINAQGGRPPLFVLNTDTGQKGNSGVATLIKGKTGVTLQVKGENDMRETINLTLTCS
jgi:hypothetical protein